MGCSGDDPPTTTSATGSSNYETCEDCDEGENLWQCACKDPQTGAFATYASKCGSTGSFCNSACQSLYDPQNLPPAPYSEVYCHKCEGSGEACPGVSSSFSCSTSWDPSSKITQVSGTYYIDQGFVNQLVDDYAPLYLCDDATVIWVDGDGFEVLGADSGELLYELGFRSEDLITEINGQPLTDYGSLWSILFAQWFQLGETSYEVELVRSESPVVLNFEIVATL